MWLQQHSIFIKITLHHGCSPAKFCLRRVGFFHTTLRQVGFLHTTQNYCILFRFDLWRLLSLSRTPCKSTMHRWIFTDLTQIFCELCTLTSSLAILSSSLLKYAITEFIVFNTCFWRDCNFICGIHNWYSINCHQDISLYGSELYFRTVWAFITDRYWTESKNYKCPIIISLMISTPQHCEL